MKSVKMDQTLKQHYDLIDKHIFSVYNENTKLGKRERFTLDDVLMCVDVYHHGGDVDQEVPPHWHYITYGLSRLDPEEKSSLSSDSATQEVSGYGFELTFRLKMHEDESPPNWPVIILQTFGEYVKDTGNILSVGDHIPWNKPLDYCEDPDQTLCEDDQSGSLVKHLLITEDPELMSLRTPQGSIQFRQLIGVLDPEIKAAQSWKGCGVLDLISLSPQAGGSHFITDMTRGTSVFDHQPYFIKLVGSEIAAAGSNLAHVTALCSWRGHVKGDSQPGVVHDSQGQAVQEQVLDKVTLYIDTEAAELLPLVTRGRLGYGRYFLFESLTGEIILFIPEGCDEPMVSVTSDTPLTAQGPALQIFCSQDFIWQMAEALDTTFSGNYKLNQMREIHLNKPQVSIIITNMKETNEPAQEQSQMPENQPTSSVKVSQTSDIPQTSEHGQMTDSDRTLSAQDLHNIQVVDSCVAVSKDELQLTPFDLPPPPPDLLEGICVSEDTSCSAGNSSTVSSNVETIVKSSPKSTNEHSLASSNDNLSKKPPIPTRTTSIKKKTDQSQSSKVNAREDTHLKIEVVQTSNGNTTQLKPSPSKNTFHMTNSLMESHLSQAPVVSAHQVSEISSKGMQSHNAESEISTDMSISKYVGLDSECYYADDDPSTDINSTVVSSKVPAKVVDAVHQVEAQTGVQKKTEYSRKHDHEITVDVADRRDITDLQKSAKLPDTRDGKTKVNVRTSVPQEVPRVNRSEVHSNPTRSQKQRGIHQQQIKHPPFTGRHEGELRNNPKQQQQAARSAGHNQVTQVNKRTVSVPNEKKVTHKMVSTTQKSHRKDHRSEPPKPDPPPKPDHLRQVPVKPRAARSSRPTQENTNKLPLSMPSLSISEKLLTGFSDLAGVGDPRFSNVEVPISSLEYAAIHGQLPSAKFVYHSAFIPYNKEQFFSPRKRPKEKNQTAYGDINLNDTFLSMEDMEWEDLPGKEGPKVNPVNFHPQRTSSVLSDGSEEELSKLTEATEDPPEVFTQDSGLTGPQSSFTSSKVSGQSKDLSVVVEEEEEKEDAATPIAQVLQLEFNGVSDSSDSRTTTPTVEVVSGHLDPSRLSTSPEDSTKEATFEADTSFVILSDMSSTSFDPDVSFIATPVVKKHKRRSEPLLSTGSEKLAQSPSRADARAVQKYSAVQPHSERRVTTEKHPLDRELPHQSLTQRIPRTQAKNIDRGPAHDGYPTTHHRSQPSSHHRSQLSSHHRSQPSSHHLDHKSLHSTHLLPTSQPSHRPSKSSHQSVPQKYKSSSSSVNVDRVSRRLDPKPSAHVKSVSSKSSAPDHGSSLSRALRRPELQSQSERHREHRYIEAEPQSQSDGYSSHRQTSGSSSASHTSRREERQPRSREHRSRRGAELSGSSLRQTDRRTHTTETVKNLPEQPHKPHLRNSPIDQKSSETIHRQSSTKRARHPHDVSVESTASVTSQLNKTNTSLDSDVSLSSNLSVPSVRRTPQMFRAEKLSRSASRKEMDSSSEGRKATSVQKSDTADVRRSESLRQLTELHRKSTESHRRSAESLRKSTESLRKATESHRKPTESRRKSTEPHHYHDDEIESRTKLSGSNYEVRPRSTKQEQSPTPAARRPVHHQSEADVRSQVSSRLSEGEHLTEGRRGLQRHQSERRQTQDTPQRHRQNRNSLPDCFTPQTYIQSQENLYHSKTSLAESEPATEEEQYKSNSLPRKKDRRRSSFKIRNPYSQSTDV